MAKNKVSEWSSTPSNNTDIGGINIAEGCAPSGINNAIRELMAQVKDMQSGTDADNFTIGGNLSVTGTTALSDDLILNSSSGTAGQVVVSQGSGNPPVWGNAFVAGMIMMWSGSIASIPSGWLLCDGTNSTPDLRNRFVVGAGSTYSVNATGGSADAIVVSHTHTATVTDTGHSHSVTTNTYGTAGDDSGGTGWTAKRIANIGSYSVTSGSSSTGITVSNSTTGSSGTNANLPPYFALAYIMKA